MHKVFIVLPIVLAACAAAGPEVDEPFAVAPVTRDTGWAGCEAEGGTFQAGHDGGMICIAD